MELAGAETESGGFATGERVAVFHLRPAESAGRHALGNDDPYSSAILLRTFLIKLLCEPLNDSGFSEENA